MLGAGTRLLAYDLRVLRRIWEGEADIGFWRWKRPPWDDDVNGGVLALDVRGTKSRSTRRPVLWAREPADVELPRTDPAFFLVQARPMIKVVSILTLTLGTILTVVSAGPSQQVARVSRVGVLFASTPGATSHLIEGLRQGLREHGYVEGRHFILEARYGQAGAQRMSDLAAELVRMKMDVIVAATDPATIALRQQTRSIPIVMANGTDPVGAGFVASLAHPGGNVTGPSALSPELSGKRLGFLRQPVPALARVAMIWNPDVRGALFDYKETEVAARSQGVKLQSVEVSQGDDLDRAFSEMTQQQAQALMVQTPNPVLFARRSQIATFAQKHRLPRSTARKSSPTPAGS